MLGAYFLSALGTLALELPLLVLLLRKESTVERILAVGFCANLMSHMSLWWILPHAGMSYGTYLFVGEAGVLVFEILMLFLLLRPISSRGVLVAVSTANLSSFLAAEALHQIA